MKISGSMTKITARARFNERYPENTLLAFREALNVGADRIELDVHRSSDGRLVVHHYYNLGHTNDGEGLIFERDSTYLWSLDAGGWFSPDFRGERIPFLEELLEACGDSTEYEVDLKGFSIEFLDAVLDLGQSITKGHLLLGRVDVAHCPLGILTQEYVRDLRKSGIRVHASNTDTEQELRAAFELGVDQLSTNRLQLALSVRQDYET